MSASHAQLGRYRVFWAEVCKAQGWSHLPTAEQNAKRKALHAELKLPDSSKDFSNHHLNIFFAACERILGRPVSPSTAKEKGIRKQLIWRIREDLRLARLDESYVQKLATDLFGLACWEELAIANLTTLRDTVHNRAGKRLGRDTRTPSRRAYAIDDSPRSFQPRGETVPF